MIAICKSNEGFEDLINTGQGYSVRELGENSVSIITNKGKRWMGMSHFRLVPAVTGGLIQRRAIA